MKHEIKFIEMELWENGFWFRLFGYGMRIINRKAFPYPFSARQYFELTIWRYGISFLKP